jgi:hypothetical protein
VRNIDDAEEWLDSWTAGVDARAARAADLTRRVAGLTATATSRDGSIEVTVGPDGRITGLRLDHPDLSGRILAVMRAAQHRITERVAAEVRDTVRQTRAAVAGTSMDSHAYGMLCQFLPALLGAVFESAVVALDGSAEALQETAFALRDAVTAVADTDAAAARTLGGPP